MKILCINIDNTINEIDIKDFKSINCLNNLSDSKGYDKIDKIYSWTYDDNDIEIYGWLLGDSLLKNNHKLPPFGQSNIIEENSDEIDLYCNIYVLCKKKNIYIDYHIHDYGNFHYIFNELNINPEEYMDNDIDEDDNIDDDIIDDIDNDIDNLIYDKSIFKINIDNCINQLDIDDNNYT